MNTMKSDNLKRFLFPLKSSHHNTTATDGSSLVGREITVNIGGDCDQHEHLIWKGLTPLEMMEKIASMTETKGSLYERRSTLPLRVDTSYLATKTPDLPPLPPGILNDTGTANTSTYKYWSKNIFRPDENCEVGSNTGPEKRRIKRNRTFDDIDENENHLEEFVVNPLVKSLPPWDPSYLIGFDNNPHISKDSIQRLKLLTVRIESMPNYYQIISSYHRLREETHEQFNYIMNSPATSIEQKRKQLSVLHRKSVENMESLITMAEKMAGDENAFSVHIRNIASNSFDSIDEVNILQGVNHNRSIGDNKKDSSNKKGFTDFMNNWLRENWTNPYPDDDGLAQMAASCGTNPTVVSNWLINARTRKWRPAIVKAYGAGRPAGLLKEDAINIFDGKPVRQISEMIHCPP